MRECDYCGIPAWTEADCRHWFCSMCISKERDLDCPVCKNEMEAMKASTFYKAVSEYMNEGE